MFWVGGLIFCLLVVYIAKALFGIAGGTLGRLPIVGGWIDSGLDTLEHKIVGTMSQAAASVDRRIGEAWHRIARLTDWMGREIASHSNLIALLASLVVGRSTVQLVQALWGSLHKRIGGLWDSLANLYHRLRALEHRLEHGIGEDVLPRIRGLEREVNQEIARERKRARAVERKLDTEVANLWKWVRTHPLVAGSTALLAAVTLALSRLGLDWLRCSNTQKVGPRICGMDPSFVERFLLDTLALVGTVSLIEFIEDAQAVEGVALEALGGFIREMPGV